MINSFLATRPTSDRTTKFISAWAEEVVKLANSKCSKVFDLHKQKANKKELESYLRKHHPELVFLNGHGSESAVAGQDNEILIEAGVNEKILEGSVTYALSCKSGKILGKQSVLAGAKAYVGYEEDFIFLFQQQNRARPLEDKTAELFFKPSNQVVISLLKGHSAPGILQQLQEGLFKKYPKVAYQPNEPGTKLRSSLFNLGHETFGLPPIKYMNLEFYNCPQPEKMDPGILPEKAAFLSYSPDFVLMQKLATGYEKYRNILIIAHGGSITTFYGYYYALKYQAKKEVYFLSTLDPDYIFELKQKLAPAETLVIAISKSGETVSQIEMMMPFANFPMIVVTGKSSPLRAIAEKLHTQIVLHPSIGGRFTGLTEVALLPAAICGLDCRGLYDGAREIYREYDKDNLAWKLASVLYQLEEKGFVDVFMPFYSHNLFPMANLIVQLCHESFGKEGKGQTYFAHEAPESQHHTNQRFFGGRKNICGLFTTVNNFGHPIVNVFPPPVHSVQIKGHHLADIGNIPLEKSMEFEAQGTMEDAKIQGIPFAHLSIAGFTSKEIGSLAAFWQLYAVYASVLRKVDPFDQPQVENSKNISFTKRLGYKGLL